MVELALILCWAITGVTSYLLLPVTITPPSELTLMILSIFMLGVVRNGHRSYLRLGDNRNLQINRSSTAEKSINHMMHRVPLVFTPQPEGGYTVTSPAVPEPLTRR